MEWTRYTAASIFSSAEIQIQTVQIAFSPCDLCGVFVVASAQTDNMKILCENLTQSTANKTGGASNGNAVVDIGAILKKF